jgi:hypothetical protein
VRGDAFWAAIDALARRGDHEPASAAAEALRRDGRLCDDRRRPVISTLTKLAAAGGRLLLLVADVGRRRPLLTRDLYLPQIAGTRLYLNGACAAGRLGLALAQAETPAATAKKRMGATAVRGGFRREAAVTELVLTSFVTAALHPELVAAFDRIAFVDPPFDALTYEAVIGAAGPGAEVHIVWGDDALHFSQRVSAAEYDLEAACRRVYRILATPSGQRDGADLAEALFLTDTGLAKLPVLAAALRVLDETGLLTTDGGDRAAGVKVLPGRIDLHDSPTYQKWHARHAQSRFLETCLTTSV